MCMEDNCISAVSCVVCDGLQLVGTCDNHVRRLISDILCALTVLFVLLPSTEDSLALKLDQGTLNDTI